MHGSLGYYIAATIAVILIGLSKGGFSGISAAAMPVHAAAILPVAILSTLAGVWLVKRISPQRFYGIILTATFLVGVKLVYDAAIELIA